jgi:hypothetical protein
MTWQPLHSEFLYTVYEENLISVGADYAGRCHGYVCVTQTDVWHCQ